MKIIHTSIWRCTRAILKRANYCISRWAFINDEGLKKKANHLMALSRRHRCLHHILIIPVVKFVTCDSPSRAVPFHNRIVGVLTDGYRQRPYYVVASRRLPYTYRIEILSSVMGIFLGCYHSVGWPVASGGRQATDKASAALLFEQAQRPVSLCVKQSLKSGRRTSLMQRYCRRQSAWARSGHIFWFL